MKRNTSFINYYNNIDEQKLVHANQLSIRDWNIIINKLKSQANLNTSYLEEWTRWFFGPVEFTLEDEYTSAIPKGFLSYYDYLNAEFLSIDARIKTEYSERAKEDGKLRDLITEEGQTRRQEYAFLSARITDIDRYIESLQDGVEQNTDDIQHLNVKIDEVDEKLQKNINSEISQREANDSLLSGRIDRHEEEVRQLEQEQNNKFNEAYKQIDNKLNIDFSGIEGITTLHKDNKVLIRSKNNTYTISIEDLAALINVEVSYFKGYYTSATELPQTGESGYYALVGPKLGENYTLYIWDAQEGHWEPTLGNKGAVGTSDVSINIENSSLVIVDPNSEPVSDSYNSIDSIKFNGRVYSITGTGSGGGSDSVDDNIYLDYISSKDITITPNTEITISYSFTREVNTNRSGTEEVYIDGARVSMKQINQGTVLTTFTVPNKASVIRIVVKSGPLSEELIYNVNVINLEITSTFEQYAVYTDTIPFMYKPIGAIEKTIHFIIDDVEQTPIVTSDTNRDKTYNITGLNHGIHTLSVYMTASLNGNTLTSNRLNYEILVNKGSGDNLILCSFNKSTAMQGDLLVFDYVVCNPTTLTTEVELIVTGPNGIYSTAYQNVDRTRQTWSIRDYPVGNTTFTIKCGDVSRSFIVAVEELDFKIESVTNDLQLHLTAEGRKNTESPENREKWNYGSVNATLSNFNWNSNGWVQDDDNTSTLCVDGDASVYIPITVFDNTIQSYGKAIELEFSTSNIRNYDTTLISCLSGGQGFKLTANKASLYSTVYNALNPIETKYKEDEKVRVTFVIEPKGFPYRLVYIYVNGVMSGLYPYTDTDNFAQLNPTGITIGSSEATIYLYNIRVYSIYLDHIDVLNNYIAETPDITEKRELYINNNLVNDSGELVYEKVVNNIPCLTITGKLPIAKGAKTNVNLKFENKEFPTLNFETFNFETTLDIQGTSSVDYPRKNYKFKLIMSYKLMFNSIPEKVFCLKADYMESSHSHNTGIAKLVNTLYPETPASRLNSKVQAAITGYPIVVWHKEDENSAAICLGVYNFNNDKDDTSTFGYTSEFPACESWEFKSNTTDYCLFKNSNFADTAKVADSFEARYPDKYKNYTALSRVVSWVHSTQGNLQKFKSEFNNYFDLNSTLLYYILTELFAMVDSRAKNLFLTTWDGLIWYPTFYDMDTAFGLNNVGQNIFDYFVEYHDRMDAQNVFNGESSVLWNNFEEAFADEIKAYYKDLRDNEKLTYDSILSVLYEEQINKISQINYNFDAMAKYKLFTLMVG